MTDFYDVIYNAINHQAQAIPDTLRNVRERDRHLIKGKQMIFTGCGDSYAVAEYGRWAFRPLGVDAIAVSPSELPRLPLDDVMVIGITASGRSLETIAALEHAQSHGATTVVLTDDREGKAAEHADYIWETKSGVSTYNTSPSAPTTSAMAYLLKLAVLYEAMPRTKIHQDSVRLENAGNAIVTWAEQRGKEIAHLLKPGDLVYLISEGPNHVAAQLGMMKFNEYSIMKGTSALREEFRHHYNLSVKDDDPVLLITDAPTSELDSVYMSVLTDTLKMRSYHLYCPEALYLESPLGQTIANSIALQMASYHFAVTHDPEKKWFKLPHAEAFRIY
ncbi:MAG: SIS domain-containing protein [Candidatus Thorarchaeota archaeon]